MNWVRKYLRKIALDSSNDFYDKIPIYKGGQCPFNKRCHWNSYTMYMRNPKRYKVIVCKCVRIDNQDVFIHFVNYDTKKKVYIDNTLGLEGYLYYNYYIIKEIQLNPSDDVNMNSYLAKYQKETLRYIINSSNKPRIIKRFLLWYTKKTGLDTNII